MISSGTPITVQNFIQVGNGFCFRACATSRTEIFIRLFLGVLNATRSQDATTDVDDENTRIRAVFFYREGTVRITQLAFLCQKNVKVGKSRVLSHRKSSALAV